jgi:hypothetical protein
LIGFRVLVIVAEQPQKRATEALSEINRCDRALGVELTFIIDDDIAAPAIDDGVYRIKAAGAQVGVPAPRAEPDNTDFFQAINDFSNNQLALSTAMLYSFTQPANPGPAPGGFPAGSLYGLNNSNPFNPEFQQQGTGLREVPGGIITFGGGVALYSNGQVIGGLGVSGDTACADHAIAFRMRKLAGFDGTPNGAGADNITYLAVGELPHDFGHPHCHVGHDITP